jgi:threonyl-tRNA synthetase
MEYVDKDGKRKTPVMIHAAVFGAFERFMGILIEHYAGAFPLWLSPVQAIIIPVSEKFNDYGEKVMEKLKANNIRVEMDDSNESLGKRIREAEKQKIPYILVVGEKEAQSASVAVRSRDKEQKVIKLEEFLKKIQKEIKEKK